MSTSSATNAASRAWRAELSFAALFAGLFLSLGAHLAFFPLWLAGRGLSPAEIGAVNAFGIALKIVAGVSLPALADWTGAPRRVMIAIALCGTTATAMMLSFESRFELYALAGVLAMVYAGLMPLSDALAYREAARQGFSYRRPRSVGSAAFIAATSLLGMVAASVGRDAIVIWIGGALLLAAIGVFLARLDAPSAPPEPQASGQDGAAAAPKTRAGLSDWGKLLGDRRFLQFLAALAALHASHSVYYAFGSVHWSSLGWSDAVIGRLWSLGVVAEIGLFLFCGPWLERIGPVRALALAGLAGGLRWGLLATDPGLAATTVLQILHAGTFGMVHLAGLAFIARAAPPSLAASAQGLVSALAGGVAMLLATMAATELYSMVQGAAYGLSAALSLLGALLAFTLRSPAEKPDPTGSTD